MSYVLEAAEAQIPVIVLDRPNLSPACIPRAIWSKRFSPLSAGTIPNRTAMTIGEAALLFNDAFGIGAELHVVPPKDGAGRCGG